MRVFREVLIYILKDNKVLLIEKKRGLGKGKVNAPGGKIENGETPLEAAVRECVEEVGIKPLNLQEVAFLEFVNKENNKDDEVHYVYVFIASDFESELKETEEAKPFWVELGKIPYEKMWESDKFWLPLILKNKRIFGKITFENWKLKSHEIFELKELK